MTYIWIGLCFASYALGFLTYSLVSMAKDQFRREDWHPTHRLVDEDGIAYLVMLHRGLGWTFDQWVGGNTPFFHRLPDGTWQASDGEVCAVYQIVGPGGMNR